jgi:thiol-disulfide isomerase/thioredoxin
MTKWNYKREENAIAKSNLKIEPVTLEEIDASGVAELARNTSDRFRLINVWATWCAPCVSEFPDLVSLSQRFRRRPYEMVTISMDNPKMQAQAKKFLENQHVSPSKELKAHLDEEGREALNFIYTGASTDAMIKALDTAWEGPLPFTVLLAPGGEIMYRQNGPIDPEEVTSILFEHFDGFYDE